MTALARLRAMLDDTRDVCEVSRSELEALVDLAEHVQLGLTDGRVLAGGKIEEALDRVLAATHPPTPIERALAAMGPRAAEAGRWWDTNTTIAGGTFSRGKGAGVPIDPSGVDLYPEIPVDFAVAGPNVAPCRCRRCDPSGALRRMVVCSVCGNKRCPRATWHENACTGSNEPGQPGSDY